jgi:cell division protein FtsQ
MSRASLLHADEGYAEQGDEDRRTISGTKIFLGLVLLVGLMVLLLWTVRLVSNPATLPIRNVRVEGEFRHLSREALRDSVVDVVRDGFFNMKVSLIQDALHANPWVAGVTVCRVWPDGLVVKVVEEQAMARWGERGLLSTEGNIFFPAADAIPQELPVFFGPENTHNLILNRYLQISETLAPHGWTLAEVRLDQRWSWSFSLGSGTRVLLGRRDVTARIAAFAELAQTDFGARMDRIAVIDMRYTNGFALRWKSENENNIDAELNDHG